MCIRPAHFLDLHQAGAGSCTRLLPRPAVHDQSSEHSSVSLASNQNHATRDAAPPSRSSRRIWPSTVAMLERGIFPGK